MNKNRPASDVPGGGGGGGCTVGISCVRKLFGKTITATYSWNLLLHYIYDGFISSSKSFQI